MPEQHPCPSCERSFGSKGALTKHVNAEHEGDTLTKLRAKWGVMAPMPGGAWHPERPLRAAPTGIPSVDHATGIGGLPRGTMVEVYGDPGVGKTSFALLCAAYAQQHGGRAGYMDAEKRFQASMALIIPGLDLGALEFCRPDIGDTALQITREFLQTGKYDIWAVDSVHGCTPQQLLDKPIGDPAAMAALARLMSTGCQVLDTIVPKTETVLIFLNHVKTPPGVRYGKDWSKPGGTALDYYASMQLRMTRSYLFHDENGRLLGQTVKVRVDNSKVAAPHTSASYEMFLAAGKIKKDGHPRNGQIVFPGVDLGSSWLTVAEEEKIVQKTSKGYADADSGELYGSARDVSEMLDTDCDLRRRLSEIVYGTYVSEQESVA